MTHTYTKHMYVCTQTHTHRHTHHIPFLSMHTTTTTITMERAITRTNATTVGQTIVMTSKTKLGVLSSTSGPSEEGVEPWGKPVPVEGEPAIAVSELHSSVTTISYCIAGESVALSDHWEWRPLSVVHTCGAMLAWDITYVRTCISSDVCAIPVGGSVELSV